MTITTQHPDRALSYSSERIAPADQTTGEKWDQAKAATADALSESASGIRAAAEAIDLEAEGTAAKLDLVASAVRREHSAALLVALRRTVRRYPASLLAIATTAGLLLGIAICGKVRLQQSARETKSRI